MATKLIKRAGERRTYDMDFSGQPEMAEATEIITAVNSVTATPAGLTLGTPIHNETRAQIQISGGDIGTTYKVIFTVQTDEASILVGEGSLKVIAD